MNESGNTILITGGANGIGKALAVRFLKADNTVIACGRDRQKLERRRRRRPVCMSSIRTCRSRQTASGSTRR
jgi:short-subunit dehydrogenase involved in D-alanine esterification of teichoic acids